MILRVSSATAATSDVSVMSALDNIDT